MAIAEGQQAFARALTDPAAAVPDGVTCRRGAADERRFAVYRNNVTVGLVKTLEKRFPVTARLVGTEFFAGMARDFVRAELPASPLLFDYGDGLPSYIEAYGPAAGVAYLADVARIEAAWTRAYHARDAPAMTRAGLAALRPEEIGTARLVRHPAAELVRSPFPAGSIWAAHQREVVEAPCEWTAETVLVARPDMAVRVHVLPRQDAAFAAALFAGDTLAEAARTAAPAGGGFDFGAALVGLVSLGAFGAVATRGTGP